MRALLAAVLALALLAASASALEVSSDTTKFSASTVSYGGTSFTLWQGYFTITVTNGGAAVSGMDVRGTALGEQVTSIETTNATGKAVLPVVTDVQPSLIQIQLRSCATCPWEVHNPNPPVDPQGGNAPKPGGTAAGGGAAGAASASAPDAASPPLSRPAVLVPPEASGGLGPGGLFNVIPGGVDWDPSLPLPAAAVPEAAAASGPSLLQALLLDGLMVGGAVGYALFARVRPRP